MGSNSAISQGTSLYLDNYLNINNHAVETNREQNVHFMLFLTDRL